MVEPFPYLGAPVHYNYGELGTCAAVVTSVVDAAGTVCLTVFGRDLTTRVLNVPPAADQSAPQAFCWNWPIIAPPPEPPVEPTVPPEGSVEG